MKTLSPTSLALLPMLAALTAAPAAHADRKWNKANDPRNMDATYTLNYNKLIGLTKGDVTITNDGKQSYKGWSESYWPMNRGYIADRWQDPATRAKFKSYTPPMGGVDAIKALGRTGIDLLSPAEKFEIITGRYDFPLTRKLIKDTDPKPRDWWKGVCDGWVMASLNIDEPRPITFVSKKDKIEVPLGASDIKGLLAFYYAKRFDAPGSAYIGKSCRGNKKLLLDIDGSCKDINAGAFHVALVNEIGIKHRGFAMDADATVQVWNQPVLKYETEYHPRATKSSHASDEAVQEVDVKTTITYANELYDTTDEELENDVHSAPSYEAVIGTPKQSFRTFTYEYVIELDANNNIIGGEWTGGDFHPDMIWRLDFAMPTSTYDEDWGVLKDILKQATAYVGSSNQP